MGCFNSHPIKRAASRKTKTIFEEGNYYDVHSKDDDDNDKRKRAFFLIN